LADMTSNCHDRLVGNLRLGELSDRMVSQIVEPQSSEGALDALDRSMATLRNADRARPLQFATSWTLYRSCQIAPRCSEALLVSRRVDVAVLTSWEYVVLRVGPAESLSKFSQLKNGRVNLGELAQRIDKIAAH
jgi:hypothetical protein